ncbi:MAG: cupin domain-containing protein [Acetobacteraceae bacterium]|nr:cupin domain-containing protein [Acetobacteraceae bacterium]
MFTRRRFGACAVCAAIGLTASEVKAETQGIQTSGTTRTILSSTEFPGGKYITVLVLGEVAPGATVARHTHPGVESAFVLEGEGVFFVKGQPDRQFKAMDGWQIQPEVPHGLRNGNKTTRVAITFVVEKDKPLASPAPE